MLYANGQSELYDMRRDPGQLRSLIGDKRYRFVRKWLYDQLVSLSGCAGPSCRVEVGPEPPPLSKKRRSAEEKDEGKKKSRATIPSPRGTGQTG